MTPTTSNERQARPVSEARKWWASLTQAERDELIMRAWPLPKPEYSATVKEAFRAWVENRVYIDGARNYRLRPEAATPTYRPNGKVAPWNKEVKRLFPSSAEFHAAAMKLAAEQERSEGMGYDYTETQVVEAVLDEQPPCTNGCVINSLIGGDHAYCTCHCHVGTLPAEPPSRTRRRLPATDEQRAKEAG